MTATLTWHQHRTTVRRRRPSAIWTLFAGMLLIRALGFAYPFLSFRLLSLGFSTGTAGLVIAAFGIGWIGGQVLSGWATDRLGPRTTLVVAMLMATAALGVLAVSRSLPVLFASVAISGMVNDAPRPIVGAFVAQVTTDDAQRVRLNGWRHFCQNLGYAVVGVLGGLLWTTVGWPALILLNAGACATFAAMAMAALRIGRLPATATTRGGYRQALRDGRLWLLLVVSLAALTCNVGLLSSLPLLMNTEGLPPSAFAWVEVVNTVAVVVMTPAMSPWLSRLATGRRAMVGTMALGCTLMGVAMGAAALPHSAVGISLAVTVGVPGEIAFLIAAGDVLNRIAPEDARGRYNGLWGTTIAAASILAPLLGSWSISHGGRPMTALTMVGVGLVGAVCCVPLARSVRRRAS